MKDRAFDADTQLLLGELQRSAEPDPGALGRVRERLAVSLTAALAGLGSKSAPSAGPAAASAPRTGWLLGAKGVTLTAFALGTGLGVGVGAAGDSWLRPPVEHTVYRERGVEPVATRVLTPPPSAAPLTPPAPSAGPALLIAARAAREAPAVEPTRPQPEPSPSGKDPPPLADSEGLAGELRLVDSARASLGAGDAAGALSALQTHAARYPHGTLEQEREALRVKALIGAARFADARGAGQRFAQRYPKSALLDSVSAAVGAIPQ